MRIKIEIKWALIFSIVTLAWMFLERVVGLHGEYIDKHPVFTNFFIVPVLLIYWGALREIRNQNTGEPFSWKKGFQHGLWLTLFIVILSPVVQLLITTIISPDYFKNAIEFGISSGQITAQEAEKYFSPFNYIIQSLAGALMMGIVASVIVAFILRSK